MSTYLLLALLAIAMLAGCIQSYRLGFYQESARQYKREKDMWRDYGYHLYPHYEATLPYMRVVREHKLSPKQLRRILNAHYSNQYRRMEHKPHKNSARVMSARIVSNIYDRRLDYQGWRKREPEIAPKHLGKDFLRRKVALLRSCNNIIKAGKKHAA